MAFLSPTFGNGIVVVLAFATCFVQPQVSSFGDEPNVKPIRALLVLGGCCHDYDNQKELLSKGIAQRAHVEVVIAYDPNTSTSHLNPIYESPGWANEFDVVIHDECSSDVNDLALMREAARVVMKGFDYALGRIKPGVTENEAMRL